jgi:hypothetical protein
VVPGVQSLDFRQARNFLMSSGETSRASDLGAVFGEQFEDVFVLLVGEGFVERLDVFEERFDGFLKRKGFGFCARTGYLKAAVFGVEFSALSFFASKASEGVSPAEARNRLPFHAIR